MDVITDRKRLELARNLAESTGVREDVRPLSLLEQAHGLCVDLTERLKNQIRSNPADISKQVRVYRMLNTATVRYLRRVALVFGGANGNNGKPN